MRTASPRRRRPDPIEPLEPRAYFAAAVTFAPSVDFAAGTAPVALAAADLNGDGRADLAVADATTQTVNVFLGNGAGAFSAGPVLLLTAPPTAILAGDVNGDGRPDLIVAASPGSVNNGTSVTVFLNAGNGTFGLGQRTTVETGVGTTEPIAIAAGDFNADGHLDVVATDNSDNLVSVLLGTGSGTFAAPVTYGVVTDPTAVAVGDFNGDGKADIAVAATLNASTNTTAGPDSDGVLVLLGGGTGQFTAGSVTPLSASGSSALAAADLVGDAKATDLAVGNADGSVSLLVNDGGDTFTDKADAGVAAGSTGIAVADFNLDGAPDVVTADGGTAFSGGADAVTVVQGSGTGTASAVAQFAVGSLPAGLAVADFNGDGRPDVATADEGGGTVSVLLNTTAVAALPTTVTLAASPTTTPAGSPVTLTATLKPLAASALTGEATPTGTVSYYDGTALLGTATVAAGGTTATLVETALSVGAHRLTAKYAGDAAYAAGASTAASVVISPTATSGPDLVASFVTVGLPATIVPGEAGTVRVRLTNQGNATATGVITDALSLSLDTTADDTDLPVALRGGLARAAVRLAPGASVVLAGTFAVPAAAPAGSYVLLVAADVNGGVAESDAGNDVTPSPAAYAVVDQFGTVGDRRNVTFAASDATGGTAVFSLAGPGAGTVAVTDAGLDVSLTGTTAASAVTVRTAGGHAFFLHDLSADAALGKLTAANVGFAGGTVTLPAGATTVSIGSLTGEALTAGGGIRSLTVDAGTGTITSPWIGTLVSRGDLSAAVTLSGAAAPGNVALKSLSVGHDDLADVTVNAGTVGTVTVKGRLSGNVEVNGADGQLAALRVGGVDSGLVRVDGGSIGSIAVHGAPADGTTVLFIAAAFPKRAVLGSAAVSPATDPHFSTPVVLHPLAAAAG